MSLRAVIYFAYGLSVYDRIDAMSDLIDQNFDVTAKAGADVPSAPSGTVGPLNVMMQNLLAERFKLVVRWEDRLRDGYALVKAGGQGVPSPRMRPSDLECPRPATISKTEQDKRSCAISSINGEMKADGHNMVAFAQYLGGQLQHPVIDKTALVGSYEIRLTFDPIEVAQIAGLPFRPIAPDGRPRAPSLFTALQEQLGLKLEPQRVPTRVLFVERLEPLSEN